MRYWRRKRNTKDLENEIILVYVSVNKGLDVDKPRNLAKSVTVE